MFEHLDDPASDRPDPALRGAVLAEGRRRRRRRRLTTVTSGAALIVVAVVAVTVLYVDRRVDRIQRVDVAGLPDDQPTRGEPSTILFVGIDSTDALPAEDTARAGRDDVSGARADTILLARLDPGANTMAVLPLPRDLWVQIPGHGPDKINATLGLGGPSLLIESISATLGIDVDRYVQTDFAGAKDLADRLGGLRLSFANPVRDQHVGLALPAGCQTLDGNQALQTARSRHLQEQSDGRWRSDPTSDFGRVERQQAVAAAVLQQVAAVDADRPTALAGLLDAAISDLTIDSGTTTGELLDLVRAIVGSDVHQLRLPVVGRNHGGADSLDLDPSWTLVVDAFRAGTPMASEPAATSGVGAATGAVVPTPC